MAPKTKKVTLTVKNPPKAHAKRRKGRKDATPTANQEMRPGLGDIEDEARAGGMDSGRQYSGPDLGLPRVDRELEVDNAGTTIADGVPTAQDFQREFDLVKGQLWTTHQVCKIGLTWLTYIAALENERRQNAELRQRVEDMSSTTADNTLAGRKPIPQPRGTAGSNFSIQEAMGLARSSKKYETYKGLQVR